MVPWAGPQMAPITCPRAQVPEDQVVQEIPSPGLQFSPLWLNALRSWVEFQFVLEYSRPEQAEALQCADSLHKAGLALGGCSP